MSRLLIVFGDKTADEILPIAQDQYSDQFAEITKVYFDDSTPDNPEFRSLLKPNNQIHFIIGVVDVQLRMRIEQFCHEQKFIPFSVIHRSAEIAASAKVGKGCFIAQQVVVSVNAVIGDFSIVHIHSSIGHDCVLGRHCSILPGARVSGEVTLGDGVLLGSNSVVFQQINVGNFCQIDALTYVRNDVPDGQLVSSRLAKPVKRWDMQ